MKLINPIKRETFTRVSFGKYKGRVLILELLPGDILSFRIKGTQQRTEISLSQCFSFSQKISFEKKYSEKLKQYAENKKAGKKVKKPKKPFIPFRP